MNLYSSSFIVLAPLILGAMCPLAVSGEEQKEPLSKKVPSRADRKLEVNKTYTATPIDAVIPNPRTHGDIDPTPEQKAEMDAKVAEWIEANAGVESFETIEVPVTFHIIQEYEGSKDNEVIGRVQKQMDVMNAAYAPHFQFNLKETLYHVNANWWEDTDPPGACRKPTRVGGKNMMNVWWNRCEGGELLGYATLPFMAGSGNDGIVNNHGTVMGGSVEDYNEGDTWVHEAGHWLGLYHTFDGGCSKLGDEVDDTPREKKPAYGCPVGRDTCPDHEGVDPIHNYMDYTYDSCMYEFTPGQITRMRALWYQYRAETPPPPTPPPTPPPSPPTPPPSSCIDSPTEMWKKNKGSILCSELTEKKCKKNKFKSHCPVECDACDKFQCKNSKVWFWTEGSKFRCKKLSNMSKEKREKKCKENDDIKYTCRATCKYCS